MKAELTLPPELVDLIADRVIEKLRPIISGTGKHEADDTIFTPETLAQYLQDDTSCFRKELTGINLLKNLMPQRKKTKKVMLKYIVSRQSMKTLIKLQQAHENEKESMLQLRNGRNSDKERRRAKESILALCQYS